MGENWYCLDADQHSTLYFAYMSLNLTCKGSNVNKIIITIYYWKQMKSSDFTLWRLVLRQKSLLGIERKVASLLFWKVLFKSSSYEKSCYKSKVHFCFRQWKNCSLVQFCSNNNNMHWCFWNLDILETC